MESIAPTSVIGGLWLEQIRRATPGPFARLRHQLDRVLESRARPSPSPGRARLAVEQSLLVAFEAACRDDPLAAEDALAELIGQRPPESLLSDLFSACASFKFLAGRRCIHARTGHRPGRRADHADQRRLLLIH